LIDKSNFTHKYTCEENQLPVWSKRKS